MNTVATPAPGQPPAHLQGNDRLLLGIIMGVVAFWLFAQTTLNIAPGMQRDLGLDAATMNIAVALTSLFPGIFIVVFGGLADRVGRLRITRIGFHLSIAGSLLVAITPTGAMAAPVLLAGRAVSMWSIGSWGGAGLRSLVGGLMSQNMGWRSIFWLAIAVSVLGLWLMRGTPENKAETHGDYTFDLPGVLVFMVAMLALQVLVTQGNTLGWASPASLGLIAATLVFGVLFVVIERRSANALFDFRLFGNSTYTGATISNFLINATAGTLIVSLQLAQLGGGMNAQQAGMLTLGYAIAIIAFIRVGEKLLQRFGPRKPMIWGCLITGVAIALLMPTQLMLGQYTILAVIGYSLFGLGLAF